MRSTCSPPNSAAACASGPGWARALSLDPDVLFFDEPSAGLDPITSSRLDDLILNLRDGLGATIVIVSHELPSLFAIADDGVFLDAETRRPSPMAPQPPCAIHAPTRRWRPSCGANVLKPLR